MNFGNLVIFERKRNKKEFLSLTRILLNLNKSNEKNRNQTSIQSYHFDMYLYSKNINKMEANLNPKDVTFSLQVSPKKKYQKMGLHDQLTMCLISKTYTMFKKKKKQSMHMLNRRSRITYFVSYCPSNFTKNKLRLISRR